MENADSALVKKHAALIFDLGMYTLEVAASLPDRLDNPGLYGYCCLVMHHR